MNIFDFDDYKKYVNFRTFQLPKKGRGQFLRMANFLSISPVTVSQIFKGNRHLTVEQACELSEFFGFTSLEEEYFTALVEQERAGTHKLKKLIENRLNDLRKKSQELRHRLKHDTQLSEETKAIFYSQWYYSAIRLITAVNGYQTPEEISKFFNLPIKRVNEVLQFLTNNDLCKEEKGLYQIGPNSTHIGSDHPLVMRHHANWRFKTIEKLNHLSSSELCLTLPCAISEKSIKLIKKELIEVIERSTKIIDDSPAEILTCLNIDLFKV